MSILTKEYFHNEEAAYEFVEKRLWPQGPVCPHCKATGDRVRKMGGESTRIGTYKCYDCRKKLTVKIGTIFEDSHVKMHLLLQAIFLIASSKKGISSNQLHRTLGVTLKTAWFMSHRVREAMKPDTFFKFGSGGGMVEVDETYIGDNYKGDGKGMRNKQKVVSLIDRTTKQARSMVVDNVDQLTIHNILYVNVDRHATLMTDEAHQYAKPGKLYANHRKVFHGGKEYVNAQDNSIHTNTIESFFGVFKRGMKGTYQHCGHNHLNRYLAEFDFRYNNRAKLGIDDQCRADTLLCGVVGKRLTYKSAH
jgi:transposase-like protein